MTALALLGLAALAHGGCRRERPPIVWIVVDTLRADHLESYGYGRATAPAVGRLAARGTLFTQARTPHPQTTPAIASMFTGLYPSRHGVRALYQLLHDQNRTAAELLRADGYDTAAFVSSFIMVRDFSHLDQGFGLYDDYVTERERYRNNYERRAGATLARAADWVRKRRGGKPFFLFIHLIDPHGPYLPPAPFDARFRSSEVVEVRGGIPGGVQMPGVRDLNRYRDLYDGEVAYAHEALGRFLDVLRERHLFDDALIVYTADHGESMGEHGVNFSHGHDVYEEGIHVPLVIKLPAGRHAPAGQRVGQAVSLVDLLPTVLALAGAPVPGDLDGHSLAPLVAGKRQAPWPVFAATDLPAMRYASLVEGTRKTVFRRANGALVTFDLARDPTERSPLAPRPAEAARLLAWRRACLERQLPFTVRDNFMAYKLRGSFVQQRQDPRRAEDEQRLRSLGYIQ